MASTKAGGSTRQKGNRRGKRLGVKIFGGQKVKSGNIILRQKGSSSDSGIGTKLARDFSIYAIRDGIVRFILKKGKKTVTVS